ncbi:MAG: helix-turn-helix transcriptional regulator [Rhodospirillales bacterium]|nr:helix-turn-helix transcriptional regulator [Rhodospirillales bacterium]
MRPSDFKRWRKSLELSQKEAAEALGLKRRMVQYYEKGERDGERWKYPRPCVACSALAAGVADYHGPTPRSQTARAPAGDIDAEPQDNGGVYQPKAKGCNVSARRKASDARPPQ